MLVAFACVRTSIMYKCSKFGISARNARNVKSQQTSIFLSQKKKSVATSITQTGN